ncbi:glutamate--tRNA ligase [Candidatus Gracilibacteria bacterium]|nr:glutamate--tRNA ligase [Candidatus Gracilibacteria bacterium]
MIVTRFPPSPTGFVHVGSLRTALYNYLLARQQKGKFIFRVEDTDRTRYVEGSVENLIDVLKWAGISYDEGPDVGGPHGPYVQSQRLDLYKKFAQELLEKGHAYYCFCTSERLEQMRKSQQEAKLAPKYDRHCLKLSAEEVQAMLAKNEPYVLRQKIPTGRSITWQDLVRGDVSFESNLVDDQVLMKSDGFPTYHLANVIDDHDMGVTHVIRGEEWLSSTPKHILLYEAFGWKIPTFAHLPLLLNKDRSKLSKRQGDVAVEDYRNKGYLPEALINFCALLGWHPGGDETQEIFTMDELIEKFSLDKVHKAGAVFDIEKLDWINWQWRRKKFDAMAGTLEEKLVEIAKPHIPKEWLHDEAFLQRCLKTVSEKIIKEPTTAATHLGFYFHDIVFIKPELILSPKMKVTHEIAKQALEAVAESLKNFEHWESEEAIKEHMLALVVKLGLKNGQVFWPTRVALTGEEFSPGVFEVLWALGKEKSLARIAQALPQITEVL